MRRFVESANISAVFLNVEEHSNLRTSCLLYQELYMESLETRDQEYRTTREYLDRKIVVI